MLNTVLENRNVSVRSRIAIQTFVSVGLVVLGAVLLPQLVHITIGQTGGVTWLPMYLPVLLAGCLLGYKWALAVGLSSPLVSFLFTFLAGLTLMPAAERIPFMMVELSIFAIVSGLFSKIILKNGNWVFLAVLTAQVSGRLAFLLITLAVQPLVSFHAGMIWNQIKAGFPGLLLQLLVVPAIVLIIRSIGEKNTTHRKDNESSEKREPSDFS